MARSHARVLCSLWDDPDFRALPVAEQRAYLMLLSQPDLAYTGVLPYRPRRWAHLAGDTQVAHIRKAVRRLAQTTLIVTDEDTEELLIRTFVRHDRVVQQPNVAKSLARSYRLILSGNVRDALTLELLKLRSSTILDYPASWDAIMPAITDAYPKGLPEDFPEPIRKGFMEGFE